jgi:hypothetical protein
MVRKIVTHPGDAHLDDLLSVSVALAIDAVWPRDGSWAQVVERREPTMEELDDPEVVVLDVGGKFNPSVSNFDHHQLPRDAEAECALSLYARGLSWKGESVIEAFGITKWFHTLKIADSKGPFQLAKELGTTPEVVFALHSPLERALLQLFQAKEILYKHPPVQDNPEEVNSLWDVLRQVGQRLLDDAVENLKRVKALDGLCRIVEISGVSGYVLESDDITGTETWRERSAPGTMFSVVYDNRGPGWTLYRYDDCPDLDFSRLQGREEIAFAHKGGFIAKTIGRDVVGLEQALELVRAAIVSV